MAWVVLDDVADRGGEHGDPDGQRGAAVRVGSFEVHQYTMSVPPGKIPKPRNSQPSTFKRIPYFRALPIAGMVCSSPREAAPHLMSG